MDTADQHFEFHRLARSAPGYRWWKPLLTALLGVVFYLVILAVVMIAGVVLAALSPTGIEPYTDALTALDLSNPVVFAFAMVSLILMIPALALATLIMGPRPIGLLSSVAGRIRWRWLLICSGVAAAVFLASIGISLAIDAILPGSAMALPDQQDASTLVLLVALSLLAVPFQAAAEEYVFRGFLMQTLGGWFRHPAFAILLPVPFFVVAHTYGLLGQIDIAVFALFAGWITWRTGGLEAAIAVHAVNNVTIFLLGAVGLADVNATDSTVTGVIVSVMTMAVTAVVIVRLADRRGIRRTRAVTPQPPVQYGLPPAHAFPPGAGHLPAPHPHQGQTNPWAQGAQQARPGAYDPQQYDVSHYPQAHGATGTQRHAVPPPLPVPPPPAPTLAPLQEEPSARRAAGEGHPVPAPVQRPLPPQEAAAQVVRPPDPVPHPSTERRRAPQDEPVDGPGTPAESHPGGSVHPSGPAFPPGTPYPAGVPHPPGPGHPGHFPQQAGNDAAPTGDSGAHRG